MAKPPVSPFVVMAPLKKRIIALEERVNELERTLNQDAPNVSSQ